MSKSPNQPPSNQCVPEFCNWASKNGVFIHPALDFVPNGHDVCAKSDIPPNTKLLSCPFGVAITTPQSKSALESLFDGISDILGTWNERQLISTYIVVHLLWAEVKRGPVPSVCRHGPYLSMLPQPSRLLTPLYFTQQELDMLQGSNLYPATLQRREEWQAEWKTCSDALSSVDVDLGSAFTWDRYLAAATYLSSRAFPSTLLSPSPTNTSPETSHPVLLPGIDSLNHRRATPVSWISTTTNSHETLDLVLHEPVSAGAQCFNNYGPKPNAELMLGYGFVLPSNPDDTILLSLAVSNSAKASQVEIGRDARNAERLWEIVVAKVMEMYEQDYDGEEGQTWEVELEAAETIIGLTGKRLQRLLEAKQDTDEVRKEVVNMIEHYIQGQQAILGELIRWVQQKRVDIRDNAAAQGVHIDPDELVEVD